MGFKDMVEADRSSVFLDAEFFGISAEVEDARITIILDNDELKQRQGGQDLAVAESATLFYARTEDLPPRRAPGQSLNVNGRECIIDDWQEDMGISTIVLRETITA